MLRWALTTPAGSSFLPDKTSRPKLCERRMYCPLATRSRYWEGRAQRQSAQLYKLSPPPHSCGVERVAQYVGHGGRRQADGPTCSDLVVQWRHMLKCVFIVSFAVCREMASAGASSHRVILFRPPTQGVGKRPVETGCERGWQAASRGVFIRRGRGQRRISPPKRAHLLLPGMIPPGDRSCGEDGKKLRGIPQRCAR